MMLSATRGTREFSSRSHRDDDFWHKRHKNSHGQQKFGKFFSFAPPAPSVQAEAPFQDAASAEPAPACVR